MTDTGQAPSGPVAVFHEAVDELVSTTKYWWLLLVTGVAWVVIAILILRFDYTTVAAIALLFGVFCLGGGGQRSNGECGHVVFVFRGAFDIATSLAGKQSAGMVGAAARRYRRDRYLGSGPPAPGRCPSWRWSRGFQLVR